MIRLFFPRMGSFWGHFLDRCNDYSFDRKVEEEVHSAFNHRMTNQCNTKLQITYIDKFAFFF